MTDYLQHTRILTKQRKKEIKQAKIHNCNITKFVLIGDGYEGALYVKSPRVIQ